MAAKIPTTSHTSEPIQPKLIKPMPKFSKLIKSIMIVFFIND